LGWWVGWFQPNPCSGLAPGGFAHLLVAVNKFSKWIEARPIVNIRSKEAVSFFSDIIYRFDIPNTIITDVGGIRNQAFRIPKIKECLQLPKFLCERPSGETPGALESIFVF
jgi:hypothetical protein